MSKTTRYRGRAVAAGANLNIESTLTVAALVAARHRDPWGYEPGVIMGDRVWQVPQDQFVAVWNGAESLTDASARLKELAGGNVPGWAALHRAMEMRKAGGELKQLVRLAPLQRV